MSGPIERIGDWLSRPAERAAENLGLFRILYGVFYLWHLSWVSYRDLTGLPDAAWIPITLFRITGRPPALLIIVAEILLVILLVMLVLGVKTRAVTYSVLVSGLLLDGFHQSFGKVEHATVFLTFYIPLIMSQSGWGDCYAWRKEHRDYEATRHAWPARAILVILGFLYFTSGWSKAVTGMWLSDPDVAYNITTDAGVTTGLFGLIAPPLHLWIGAQPAVSVVLQATVVVFETFFFLALVSGSLRRWFVRCAVLFHAANALLLSVTFTPIAIVYGLFVDWQWWVDRAARSTWAASRLNRRIAIGLLAALAATTILFQLIDWRTFWAALLIAWLAAALLRSYLSQSLKASE